jgi:hypothetical protein
MSAADPTAAERARRYRARRRDREELHAQLGEVATEPALEALGDAIAALVLEVRELRAERGSPAPASHPDDGHAHRFGCRLCGVDKPVETVDKRDASRRHAGRRDVTARHAGEGAPARTRETGDQGPTGPVIARERERHARAVAELLEGALAPPSLEAIADQLDAPQGAVLLALEDLVRRGVAERITPPDPRDRERYRLLPPDPEEIRAELGLELAREPAPTTTIACSSYREHATLGHRWDPIAGRFRCYVCEPAYRPAAS